MKMRIGTDSLLMDDSKEGYPVLSSSISMCRYIPLSKGLRVLDLGCGSGLFGLCSCLRGAKSVLCTDIDPLNVRVARRNARVNKLDRIRFRVGDMFQPVRSERFDLIICNFPQTPGARRFPGGKWGGRDGTKYLRLFIKHAGRFLYPGGQVYMMVISLADTQRVLNLAKGQFEMKERGSRRRYFVPSEYEGYQKGLMRHLRRQRERGRAEFQERPEKSYFTIRYFTGRKR